MGIPLDTRQIEARAQAMPATGAATGFIENTIAAFDQFRRENLSTSEAAQWGQEWQQQADLAKKHGVDAISNWNAPPDRAALQAMKERPGLRPIDYWHEKREQQFADLKKQFPDAGFKTNEEMFSGMVDRMAQQRRGAAITRARASGPGEFGAFLGDMAGATTDPVVALTLPFGAAESAGILRAALTEAAIASTTEASVQPQIAQFRAAIGNPQAEGEAMSNILLAGGGAAAFTAAIKAIPLGYRALANHYRTQMDAGAVKPTVQQQAALDLLERHAVESEANPYNRSLEGTTEAHAANLKAADLAAADGRAVDPKELQTPATAGEVFERRANPEKRKVIEDLQAKTADLKAKIDKGEASPAELKRALDELDTALHTSEKAPALQNERAFHNFMRDKTDAPVLFFDLDNFKKVNDENSHDVGDQVIRAVGDLAKEVSGELGLPVYHKSGDEFLGGGGTVETLNNLGAAIQKRLENASIEVELPDGSIKTITEVRLSFGVASGKTTKNSIDAAEAALHVDKQRRKAAGLRTDRPDELSSGQPGRQNPQDFVSKTAVNQPVPRGARAVEEIEAQSTDAAEALDAEVKALLLENPELKVAGSDVVGEDGVRVASKTAQQLLDEVDEEARLAKEFSACVMGTTEAAA